MLRLKKDLLAELAAAGYTATVIRNEKIMGEAQRTKLRNGKLPSWMILDRICELLNCQPGDLIEWVKDE